MDKRADIWAFGCVLYEMLTGRRAMSGDTVSDILAAVLTVEPDWSRLPATTPPRVVALIQRCLAKDVRDRFRDVGDARFELKEFDAGGAPNASTLASRRKPVALRVALAVLTLTALAGLGYGVWPRSGPAETGGNPLADADFKRITDFPGTELNASISPDGRFVAFMSDHDGPMHLWLTQIGSGRFTDLTKGMPAMTFPRGQRAVGFSGDGTEVWTTLSQGNQTRLIPLIGGEPRPFLSGNAINPSWSPDGASLTYFRAIDGDPVYVADRSGGNAREIFRDEAGTHNHNPVWSPDGQWIYFVHGKGANGSRDIWRIRPSGERREQVTDHRAQVSFVAPLNARTLLFVALAEDRSGPWLWSLDVGSRETRRVTTGVEQFLSVAASADGQRIVATVANPSVNLWTLPILDRPVDERDIRPFPVPNVRALGPRFGGGTLFYLSSRGGGDGLWRAENGQTSEIWKGSDGPLAEPAAVSRDGRRVAIVVRRAGRGQITVMNADGADSRDVAPSLDVQGVVDWAPDGTSIVAGATDAEGPGAFIVPFDGKAVRRLTKGIAGSPAWSPSDNLIVYTGPNVGAREQLLAVRPDGTDVPLPAIYIGVPGTRTPIQGYRFLPDGTGLMYTPAQTADLEFWVLNLATRMTRRVAKLALPDEIRTFDLAPDGRQIIFDRRRDNADIVLIERKQTTP